MAYGISCIICNVLTVKVKAMMYQLIKIDLSNFWNRVYFHYVYASNITIWSESW